jgi:putative FmdB family regulatory protein
MPLYEYRCKKCNEVFEVLQRFSDAPVKVHDACGGKVARLLTAPNFKFKGTGFYITDYPNKHDSSPAHDSNGSTSSNGSNDSDGGKGKESSKPATPAPASTTGTSSKPAPAASTSDK